MKFFDWERLISKKREKSIENNIDTLRQKIDDCFKEVEDLSELATLSKVKQWEKVEKKIKAQVETLKNALVYQKMEREDETEIKILIKCFDYLIELIADSDKKLEIALRAYDELAEKQKGYEQYQNMKEKRRGLK